MTRYLSFAIVLSCIVFIPSPVLATSYYTEGHADLGLGEGSSLGLEVHCHAGTTVDGVPIDGVAFPEGIGYEPTDIVIVVPDSTRDYVNSQGGARLPRLQSIPHLHLNWD